MPSSRLSGAGDTLRAPGAVPAAQPLPAVVGTAPPAARHGQRGRLRHRLVRAGRPGARPLPAGRTDLGRRAAARPGAGGTHRRAARRRAGRHGGRCGRRGRGRAVRRRTPSVQPQRRGDRLAGLTRPAGRGAARRGAAAAAGPLRRGVPVGAGPAPAGARRRARRGTGRHRHGRRRRRTRLPAQSAAHRRHHHRRHRLGRHALPPGRPRRRHSRRLRTVQRFPHWTEVPDRTLLRATRTEVHLTPLKEPAT